MNKILKFMKNENIINNDKREEEEIINTGRIKQRLKECLGKENATYELSLKYSILWHRLFTEYNKEKPFEERIISPVGILEEYCELYNVCDFDLKGMLYVPMKFNDVFLDNSFIIKLKYLPEYYSGCHETLFDITNFLKGEKSLNNIEVFNNIENKVYRVPEEWKETITRN